MSDCSTGNWIKSGWTRSYVLPLRASFASKNGIPVVKKGGTIDRTGELGSHSQVRSSWKPKIRPSRPRKKVWWELNLYRYNSPAVTSPFWKYSSGCIYPVPKIAKQARSISNPAYAPRNDCTDCIPYCILVRKRVPSHRIGKQLENRCSESKSREEVCSGVPIALSTRPLCATGCISQHGLFPSPHSTRPPLMPGIFFPIYGFMDYSAYLPICTFTHGYSQYPSRSGVLAILLRMQQPAVPQSRPNASHNGLRMSHMCVRWDQRQQVRIQKWSFDSYKVSLSVPISCLSFDVGGRECLHINRL